MSAINTLSQFQAEVIAAAPYTKGGVFAVEGYCEGVQVNMCYSKSIQVTQFLDDVPQMGIKAGEWHFANAFRGVYGATLSEAMSTFH